MFVYQTVEHLHVMALSTFWGGFSQRPLLETITATHAIQRLLLLSLAVTSTISPHSLISEAGIFI